MIESMLKFAEGRQLLSYVYTFVHLFWAMLIFICMCSIFHSRPKSPTTCIRQLLYKMALPYSIHTTRCTLEVISRTSPQLKQEWYLRMWHSSRYTENHFLVLVYKKSSSFEEVIGKSNGGQDSCRVTSSDRLLCVSGSSTGMVRLRLFSLH